MSPDVIKWLGSATVFIAPSKDMHTCRVPAHVCKTLVNNTELIKKNFNVAIKCSSIPKTPDNHSKILF